MSEAVKTAGGLRAARVADTEQRIVAAAHRLFVRDGYAATTLSAVADAAGVAHRTVYVRFGTKAALLKRVIRVAQVGDTLPIDVQHRDWFQISLTAPTLAERIQANASGASELMRRAGDVIAVAQQAEPVEPEIAEAAAAARTATCDALRRFWTCIHADGLIPDDADLEWLTDTSAVLAQAQTYLFTLGTLGWTVERYHRWLETTWTRLASAAGQT